MADGGKAGFDSGWNVGTNNDTSTCLAGTTGTGCHDSCAKRGWCGRCSWSPCYDDRAFVEQLLALLLDELHYDKSRVYAVGESNGAMLIHFLAQTLPGTFAAVSPVFGLPLIGYAVGPTYNLIRQAQAVSRTSLLQIHDRSDVTIPWRGGNSSDGWLYESLERSTGPWAAIHGCELVPSLDPIQHDPKTRMACYKHRSCQAGSAVAYCMYDGTHGAWPSQPIADRLIWTFFTNRTLGAS